VLVARPRSVLNDRTSHSHLFKCRLHCVRPMQCRSVVCYCRVRGVDGSCAKHLTVESYTVIYAANSYRPLIIISFPSPTLSLSLSLSFIPDLKPSFSANPPRRSLSFFFRTDYMIPQTFTVTSEHIRFYFLVFLFYNTLFSCCFHAVD